jgi:hypothetical protein
VVLQRGFVAVDGALRLYACVVGTPAGVHYAYDLESGALLSVWRGDFADLVEMWGPRARNQTARPAGEEVAITAKPFFAQFPDRMMIEFPKAWPTQPAPLYASAGYELEKDGRPIFLATLETLAVRDRIEPDAARGGLKRTLEFSGRLPEWQTWVVLAEADAIAAGAEGTSWTAGAGGRWKIEFAPGAPHTPIIRTESGRQLLVVRLNEKSVGQPLSYRITW